jgi:predicted nucleotidyltransferase
MTNGEVTGDDHPETFSLVLGEVADAFDGSGIPYVIIGSVASTYYGRPGSNGDLDVLVRPQEAKRALEALGQSQFQTDEFEPAWIF